MQLQAFLRIIVSLSRLKIQSDIFDAPLNVSECPQCLNVPMSKLSKKNSNFKKNLQTNAVTRIDSVNFGNKNLRNNDLTKAATLESIALIL